MANKTDPRIAALLAAYGSDITRWPAGERERLARLAPDELTDLERDHKALDQLIANARDMADDKPAAEGLMARIMDAVPPQERGDGATVVAFEVPQNAHQNRTASAGVHGDGDMDRAGPPPTITKRDLTAAAALLAASLVLGVFIGTTETGRSTAATVGTLAGLNLTSQTAQLSAIDEALQVQDDEDIL